TLGVPNSPGVTAGTVKDTIVLTYNDVNGLVHAFEQHDQQIAGVILEPVVGNMGCVTPSESFLTTLRQLTQDQGTLLIYDEVMSGFRVALGGAQSLQGVTPDLTTMGKIVGGGLPLGAYGGRADIMDHILPAGKVFQAGTLSGNPIATAAGIAMLTMLRDESPYSKLDTLSSQLAEGLVHAAAAASIPHSLCRVGSMMTLFFAEDQVVDWPTASRCDTARFAKYFWGMADRGIYMPCSQFEALFVSAAHTTDDIERTIAAAREVFATL
ncbi:MAG: aminotransferase class III-fold pyridoxal phosphate-dependent enzyme, partial [Planctomycetales bacterium]|nr:aminotransferase class III-fold pyridoxal phosphate-dependent enzyme [Planctomycetales bacterium]